MSGPVLTEAEIRARLPGELPHWAYDNGALERTYRTHGWKGSLIVVNTIGHLAEAAWHHPDLHVSYPSVTVRLNTHDAGGVTEKDFALARKIEEVVTWRPAPGQGAPLEGVPDAHAYIRPD